MGELRECRVCDQPFVDDAGWKLQCVACWKKERGWDLAIGDKAFVSLREAFIELRQERDVAVEACKEAREQAARSDRLFREARRRLRAVKQELRAQEEDTALSPQRVRSLIKLCHPDKHQNSDLSHQTTLWLLSLRKKK